MEYDQLIEEIKVAKERNRCFDLQFARYVLRAATIHNGWMCHAVNGDRECEAAVAEQLGKLEAIRAK